MAINSNQFTKPYSIPHIENQSFDPELQVKVTELVGYDPVSQELKRVTVNSDGQLSVLSTGGPGGSAAYSDSGDVDKKGLVDADRHVQVDVLTMPGVTVDTTGLATSAKQDTIIGHVDGIEGLLTTIDADTGTLAGAVTAGKVQAEVTNSVTVSGTVTANAGTNLNTSSLALEATATSIKNAVEIIDNAIAGTEMQVDVVTMPTTTVTATALDIRNLTSTDVVTVTGGAGQTADVKVTLDGESVPVTGTFWQATQPVSGTVTANLAAGTNNIGDVDILSIAAGDNNIGNVDIVTMPNITIGSALPAGTNAIGNIGIIPRTSGGLTTYHLISAGTTNATVVKNSSGQLFGWYIYNSNASARKVAFHNTSSTPTAGASIFFTIVIPGSSGANVFSDIGIVFSSGIAITTVTDLTDAGTTAVAANDLNINLFYA